MKINSMTMHDIQIVSTQNSFHLMQGPVHKFLTDTFLAFLYSFDFSLIVDLLALF